MAIKIPTGLYIIIGLLSIGFLFGFAVISLDTPQLAAGSFIRRIRQTRRAK